jgi:hypothetical protein
VSHRSRSPHNIGRHVILFSQHVSATPLRG